MNFKLVILIILFIICIYPVYAGDNSTDAPRIINESVTGISDVTVSALEDGHFNTSFSDGSNGYCLEYGEEEARTNDIFYKVDTSYARNNLNGSIVGNYLKLYFVEYTSHALSDKIRTQHMIWHFTDDFDGWRLNYTIINEIKNSDRIIPDEYVQVLNNTHERVWLFHVSISPFEHHQNYFNYKFYDKLINNENGSSNESSGVVNESASDSVLDDDVGIHYYYSGRVNDYHNQVFNETIKNHQRDVDKIVSFKYCKSNDKDTCIKSVLNKHLTGYNYFNTFLLLLFSLVYLIGIYIIQKIFIK